MTTRLPADITVLERGWLSSNNIVLHGAAPDEGAVLVDTGYASHVEQTLALVDGALAGERLRLILNTHLHSDHCGGNAALVARHRCALQIPPRDYAAALAWHQELLSFRYTGQRCERFTPDSSLSPGDEVVQAGRRWQVHAAPGHDPASVILFEPNDRILISADALWERGFGIVFPELHGGDGFDEVESTLALIEQLNPSLVIPGHGAVFSTVSDSLATARKRLHRFRNDPVQHAEHAMKALLMFHLLEHLRVEETALKDWMANTPVMRTLWSTSLTQTSTLPGICTHVLEELLESGHLTAMMQGETRWISPNAH